MLDNPRRERVQPASSKRILVVDDNADAAETLGDLLDHWGHQVVVTLSGVDALSRAQRETPEVVILDLAMPEMDGWECARRLRAVPELQRTLLIALTGFSGESERQQSYEAGFDHHLTKPPDLDHLRRLLV